VDEPVVQHAGEGELVFDDETGSSRIKVARDEILLSETTLRPGARGARPHVHREHADAFYVLEGSLDFHVAGEQRTIEAGGLVLAPPGLVHGFEVGANGDRHLNIHTPGAAFARLTRARRDGVSVDAGTDGDTFSPPEDGGRPAADGIVLGSGDGEALGTTILKAELPQVSVLELEIRPEGGVSPHFHKGHSDSFYVLEGEVEIHLGDSVFRATRGCYALAPPQVVHWFRNVSDSPARVLNLHTPGGFGTYRRELEAFKKQGIEPDRAFFERHDIFDV
jgi:quercetin dioxygenase-like cupin family protein